MEQVTTSRNYWHFESDEDHYLHLVGHDYGPYPAQNKASIQKDKANLADYIRKVMKLNPTERGLEIGCGCGHMIRRMASFVEHIHGCDISPSYLEITRQECLEIPNASFQLINNGELTFLSAKSINFVYSNNVFIHMDFYEIVPYLYEVFRVLDNGGRFWFDIADLDRVNFVSDADFLNTLATKKVQAGNKNCLHHNSAAAVASAATQIGFTVVQQVGSLRANTSFLFKKS